VALLQMLSRPLSIGRELATKKIIKQFARKFSLVYFGYVNQREDEHELIRGITVSATHVDTHFCVGDYKGHDISLVERHNTLIYPDQMPVHYHWVIMQVDLKREGLPHVFIDGNHHEEAFYMTLFMKFANMSNATALFTQASPLFARTFQVFVPADKFDEAEMMLGGDVAAMVAHHFKQFDYEIDNDRVLIYAENPVITSHLLHEMLRVGQWLAAQLDKSELTASQPDERLTKPSGR
jgi:hypothetical protein